MAIEPGGDAIGVACCFQIAGFFTGKAKGMVQAGIHRVGGDGGAKGVSGLIGAVCCEQTQAQSVEGRSIAAVAADDPAVGLLGRRVIAGPGMGLGKLRLTIEVRRFLAGGDPRMPQGAREISQLHQVFALAEMGLGAREGKMRGVGAGAGLRPILPPALPRHRRTAQAGSCQG